MPKETGFEVLAFWLLVIGGLNWGLTLFGFNLVDWLGNLIGQLQTVQWIVYGMVMISAIVVGFRKISTG